MFNNIKSFINYLDIGFSKAFFGCQSIARRVLRDRISAMLRPDISGGEFEIVKGRVTSIAAPSFDVSLASSRSNGVCSFSQAYRVEEVPLLFSEIISTHYDEIINYLGRDFLHEPPLFFRTWHMPSELETYVRFPR